MENSPYVQSKSSLKPLLFVAVIAFVVGAFAGPHIRNYVASRAITDAQSVQSLIENSEQLPILVQVWNRLDADFINETPSANDKLYGMIKGLVASYGDPYTEFFDPKEAKEFSEQVSGAFEGIGLEVDNKEGIIVVVAPIKNTPAYKAGIKSGDIIAKIDGETTAQLSLEEAIKKMRGKKGTHVVLTVLRQDTAEPIVFDLTRDTISVPIVEVKHINDVRIVALYTFTENSYKEFKEAVSDYDPKKEKGLIIDLRSNPGGYLDASVDIASLFLEAGEVVLREQSKDKKETVYRSKGYKTVFQNNAVPVVILVDGGSASASEILAGALSEKGNAIIVGTQTYGKGSVQEYQELPLGTSMKVTVAEWHTPNDVSISKEGLKPDVVLPLDVDLYAKEQRDNQIEKAIEIIAEKG